MKQIVFFLGLLILLAVSVAAEEYSLEQCIQMAIDTDPILTRDRTAVSQAKADVLQQMGQFLPSLSTYLTRSSTKTGPATPNFQMVPNIDYRSTDSVMVYQGDVLMNTAQPQSTITGKGYSAGLRLDYTLFDGFQNVWGFLGSRASKRQAEHAYTTGRSGLVFRVKTDYYFALKSKRDVNVAREAVKRSEELLKLFQEKFQVGSASKSEVLKQRVQYGNDELTLVKKENVLREALNQLALDIGIDPKTEYSIADLPVQTQPLPAMDDLIGKATTEHPAILASQAGVDAFRYDVRSAWGWYLPNLSLGYSYGWTKDRFSDIIKGGPYDHRGTLTLSLSYTLFDGFTRERNLKRAKIGLTNSRISDVYARNQVLKEIRDAYQAVKLAEETMRVTTETEEAASEDMQLVQAKYNLGSAALWELLDAQVSLLEAQFNKVTAEFDYNLSLAGLLRAMGE